MSSFTWYVADSSTMHTNAWIADSTSNSDCFTYRFDVRAGTTAVGTQDIWNWAFADVTRVQTIHTWVHSGESEESKKKRKERRKEELKERWGVEELPKLTVEELREVELNSERFLADVLSPDELVMFKAENKVRVESGLEPEVHYIVKRARMARIERHVKGKLVETLGFFACWEELPELDVLATKVFDLKHNEAMVLKKSCRAAAPRLS